VLERGGCDEVQSDLVGMFLEWTFNSPFVEPLAGGLFLLVFYYTCLMASSMWSGFTILGCPVCNLHICWHFDRHSFEDL